MDERRITCSSGNKTNDYHEENRPGRRQEAHKISRLLLCALCVSIAIVCLPQSSSAKEKTLRAVADNPPAAKEPKAAEGANAEPGSAEPGSAESTTAKTEVNAKTGDEKKEVAKTEGEKTGDEETKNAEKAEAANNENKANETTNNEAFLNETMTNETMTNETALANETATNETGITALCPNHCWESAAKAQDITFEDGIYRQEITDEPTCKKACTNNETCTGSYWGFNDNSSSVTCWHQTTVHGESGNLSNADHWTFNNCSEDCSPYCWKEKELNVQTRGGVRKHDVQDEEHCKSLCSEDLLCDGADWNVTNSSCWLIFKHTRTTDVVYHWEIVRDLQTSCSKSEERCTPRCWNKTAAPELSVKDGLHMHRFESETECKEFCGNNQTCIGVYMASNGNESNTTSCWFQMPFEVSTEPEVLTTVTHWTLANCTEDCFPYCWLPKFDHIQTAGGVKQDGDYDENLCKVKCANDEKCRGIDFNTTAPSCWILHDLELIVSPTSDAIHHWVLEKNLPMVCGGGGPGGGEPVAEPQVTAQTEPPPAEPPAEQPAGGGAPSGGEKVPETGESNVGQKRTKRPKHCPSYLLGIITLSSLMGVCVLIIIGLIAFILARTVREEAKSGGN